MKREFLPYNEALELKAIGFDEPCAMYWSPEMDGSMQMWYHQDKRFDDAIGSQNSDNAEWVTCTAPLYQQAFRWFREKHGWISNVWTICISTDGITSFEYAIDTLDDLGVSQYRENFPYKTYEEAELECLKALIEIVKNK